MPATETKPVVLLAREGQARDNLRLALAEANARIVLEADPAALEVAALKSAPADTVVVALDPATEDSLDCLDQVLHDPAVNVIYEDAELAANRSGWDAQRWVRHLSAKLHGHRDVLPPGRESDHFTDLPLQPGRPVTPAQLHDGQPIQPHLDEARDLAHALPQAGPALSLAEEDSGPTLAEEDDGIAVSFVDGSPSLVDEAPAAGDPAADTGLSLVLDEEPLPAADAAAPLFQPDEPEAWRPPSRPLDDALVEGFGTLSLEEVEAEPAPAAVAAAVVPPPLPEAAPATAPPLETPAAASVWTLELEPLSDAPAGSALAATGGASGAVLLLAGIGGPDAVRRVLVELPEDFPLPLLLHLPLDGGRYDNLVKQLERISPMPVMLARAGETAHGANVYVLPGDVAATVENDKIRFGEGATDAASLIAALPSQSAVLLLSGSDPACVDAALALAAKGGYAGGQSPKGCYDPAAAKALQARGGAVGDPAALAAALVQRT
ncbi:MAG: chemotaxis protein CheB [Pseudoxanthomonas sp.]